MEAFGSTAESHRLKSSTDFSVSLETTTNVVKSLADVDLERAPGVISFAQFSKLQSSSGFSKTLPHCVGFSDHGDAKATGVVNSTPSTDALIQSPKHADSSKIEESNGSLFSLHSPPGRPTPSLDQEPQKLDIENSSSFGDNWNCETQNVSLAESKHDQSELLFSSPESSKESEGDAHVMKEEDRFSVGDFVWSKIKNNLWWPGQIYSSSDASSFALKYKQEDHHLVAYFGDGSFSWCSPSQLEHFENHFDPMSKQSNSKGFFSAVQMALVEVGRRLEMELSCSCFPFDTNSLPQPILNAGIKHGTCLDERRGKISFLQYEPSDLLNILQFIAQNSFSDNMFDLTVLKSWFAALYKAKGGHHLPIYSDPLPVLDQVIADRNTLLEVFEFTERSHVEGVKEEKVSAPVGGVNNQSLEYPSRHIHNILDEQLSQRKQKSMIDIMGEQGVDGELQHSGDNESGEDSQDSGPELIARGRKKTNNSLRFSMRSAAQSKSGRRRKVGPSMANTYEFFDIKSGSSGSEDESTIGFAKDKRSHFTDEIQNDDSMQGPKKSTMRQNTDKKKSRAIKVRKKEALIPDRRVKMEEEVTQEHGDSTGLESSRKVFLTRERKKSKYLSPPYTTEMDEEDTTVSRCQMEPKLSLGQDGVSPQVLIWGTDDVCPLRQRGEYGSGDDKTDSQNQSPKGMEFDLNESRLLLSDEALSELQSVAQDLWHLGYEGSLDALKKFFFLFRCFVYSSRYEDGKPMEVEFEAPRVASVSLSDDPFHRPVSPGVEQGLVAGEEGFTHSPMPDVVDERHHLQMEVVEPATADPVSSRNCEMGTGDGFTQSTGGDELLPRSIVEHTDEATKAESMEEEICRQEGIMFSEVTIIQDGAPENVGDNQGGGQKRRRGRPKITDALNYKQKKQQLGEVSSSSGRGIRRRREGSSCAAAELYISFPPAMKLPSKENLVEMYEMFGAIIDTETHVSHNSFGARVAFERMEDAERAFISCSDNTPFGDAQVSFQLQHPSGVMAETTENNNVVMVGEEEVEKREGLDIGFIRQKLLMMTSMLEGSDVMLSTDILSSLESEMEKLLEMLRSSPSS